jgi:hypothetical protein
VSEQKFPYHGASEVRINAPNHSPERHCTKPKDGPSAIKFKQTQTPNCLGVLNADPYFMGVFH